jgi:hypothetical protein
MANGVFRKKGPCILVWKNPSRMHGCKWGLLKVRKRNTKDAWWVQVESTGPRQSAFLFQMLLKPTLTYEEGRPRRFPHNDEQVGRAWAVPSPGKGGLDHPRATYMSPKLIQPLACLIWR